MTKLLIVDDEIDICDFTRNFFRDRGFDVACACRGEEALQKIKTENPQVAIFDIRMPGMDGLEVLEKAKKIKPELIVIMVTAVVDEAVIERAKSLGAVSYVTKPLELDKLLEEVNRAIGR